MFNGLRWTGADGSVLDIRDGGTYSVPIGAAGTAQTGVAVPTSPSSELDGMLYHISASTGSREFVADISGLQPQAFTWQQAGDYELDIYYSLNLEGGVVNDRSLAGRVLALLIGNVVYAAPSAGQTPFATIRFTINDSSGPRVDNVLFLPGIEGSTLYDEGTGKEVWLPDNDATADELRLNADGTSVNPDITASGVLAQAGPAQLNHVIYANLLQEMGDWETTYHITATSTPYDWRLDYDTLLNNGRKLADGHISYLQAPETGHDPYLIETLKQLAATSKTGKVTIIAHSNGGLLAKALMQKLGDAETVRLIDDVILVASPQLGTPLAVWSLLNGHDAGILNALSDEKARSLSLNMPMTYSLLPSSPYFTYVDDPVVTISSSALPSWASAYGSVMHWAQGLYNFITDSAGTRAAPAYDDLVDPQIGNAALLARAQAAHVILDSWTLPPSVHLYTIAGWGNETFASVNYYGIPETISFCAQLTGSTCAYYGHEIVMSTTTSPRMVIDGDGTVIAPSASWASGAANAQRYWVNLDDYNGWLEHQSGIADALWGTHHENIFNIPQLRTLLISIITASATPSLPQYISTSTPAYTGDMDRLHFVLHSPLTLGFIDTSGNYTGFTATTTEFNIPGVDYERFGEVQWLSVPKSLAGQVVMRGTGSGSFALDIESQHGDTVIASTTFAAIPSATSTVATLTIDPSIDPTASSTLEVDYDDNGKIDSRYEARQGSMVIADVVPPEAVIGFSTTTNEVEVRGVDETSATVVVNTATSTTVTDLAGNWLALSLKRMPGNGHDDGANHERDNSPKDRGNKDESGAATLIISSLSYSTGATTNAAATLHYAWSADRSGGYHSFVSLISTPSGRLTTVYSSKSDQTYIVATSPKDDEEDLPTHIESLLQRKHLKTYNGLYIPTMETREGRLLISL